MRWCNSDTKQGAQPVLVHVSYPLPSWSPGFPSREEEGSINPCIGIVEAFSHTAKQSCPSFLGMTVFSRVDVSGTSNSFSAFHRLFACTLHVTL